MADMLKVTIRRISKNKPFDLVRSVNAHASRMKQGLLKLAVMAQGKMQDVIQDNIKREGSTGKLSSSIQVYTLGPYHYAVGKTSDMPVYWEVIDQGGYVPPATIGNWSGTNAPHDRFVPGRGLGTMLMVPVKAIEGMHYVMKTHAWLGINWTKFWSSYFNKYKR